MNPNLTIDFIEKHNNTLHRGLINFKKFGISNIVKLEKEYESNKKILTKMLLYSVSSRLRIK